MGRGPSVVCVKGGKPPPLGPSESKNRSIDLRRSSNKSIEQAGGDGVPAWSSAVESNRSTESSMRRAEWCGVHLLCEPLRVPKKKAREARASNRHERERPTPDGTRGRRTNTRATDANKPQENKRPKANSKAKRQTHSNLSSNQKKKRAYSFCESPVTCCFCICICLLTTPTAWPARAPFPPFPLPSREPHERKKGPAAIDRIDLLALLSLSTLRASIPRLRQRFEGGTLHY